jgi:hypothetical protein
MYLPQTILAGLEPAAEKHYIGTHSDNVSQVSQIWVGFFKGVDTADPIGATTWSDGSDDDNTSVSHTSSLGTVDADDMSIMASYYWGGHPTNAGGDQTLFANITSSDQSLFVVGELGESSLNVTGLDYPISVAFVLQAAAAGGTTEVDIAGAMGFAGAVNPQVRWRPISCRGFILRRHSFPVSTLKAQFFIRSDFFRVRKFRFKSDLSGSSRWRVSPGR